MAKKNEKENSGSQFMKNSMSNGTPKRPAKAERSEDEDIQECDFSKIVGQYASAKKRKSNNNSSTVKQLLLQNMNQQWENRKQATESINAALCDLRECLEVEYEALKENEAKIQRMAAGVIKCMQQTTSAAKQKLQLIDDMMNKYKDQCEELEHNEKLATTKMWKDIKDHINQLQAKLAIDVRRQQMDKLRKSLQAMHDE